MKVIYRISNHTTIEIETSEEIAMVLIDSYRAEDRGDRQCRRHNYSYDILDYESEKYAAPDTPESIAVDQENAAESQARHVRALALLTEIQRNRFLMYAAGMSTCEIARREGVHQKSVSESIEAARKKLQKFYGVSGISLNRPC